MHEGFPGQTPKFVSQEQQEEESDSPIILEDSDELAAAQPKTEEIHPEEIQRTVNESPSSKDLRQDIQDERRTNTQSVESLERERGIKEGARYVSEAATVFAREIKSREQNGMDPFMDARSFNELRLGAVTLAELSQTKEQIDMDQLGLAVTSIDSGLNNVEKTRMSGPIHESEDSLGRLTYAMRNLYDATEKMSKNFREGDELASFATRRLRQTSERVYGFAGKLRATVRNRN